MIWEDVDYAVMLFVLLDWPADNNSILWLSCPRFQVHVFSVRGCRQYCIGSMGEIGYKDYSNPSHQAMRWQYQLWDYITASCDLKLMLMHCLLEEKNPFYNERKRKAFQCVIQHHREIMRRFRDPPTVTKLLVCLEFK